VAIHTGRIWKRHSNPWSGWTRILIYPLVYLPFWNRRWKQGVAVAAWFAANPLIFPAPEDDSSWATRSVPVPALVVRAGARAPFFAGDGGMADNGRKV
jgi:hypothetical protein